MTIEQGESHHACTARRNPNYHLAALAMHIFPLDLWDMFLFSCLYTLTIVNGHVLFMLFVLSLNFTWYQSNRHDL
jgi:hypothetical protein